MDPAALRVDSEEAVTASRWMGSAGLSTSFLFFFLYFPFD
jgi:hypothetical protein